MQLYHRQHLVKPLDISAHLFITFNLHITFNLPVGHQFLYRLLLGKTYAPFHPSIFPL